MKWNLTIITGSLIDGNVTRKKSSEVVEGKFEDLVDKIKSERYTDSDNLKTTIYGYGWPESNNNSKLAKFCVRRPVCHGEVREAVLLGPYDEEEAD